MFESIGEPDDFFSKLFIDFWEFKLLLWEEIEANGLLFAEFWFKLLDLFTEEPVVDVLLDEEFAIGDWLDIELDLEPAAEFPTGINLLEDEPVTEEPETDDFFEDEFAA